MSHGPVGDFSIAGKIICITGGGSGIGLALAKLAHSNSTRVVIGDLKLIPEAQAFVDSVPSSEVIFVPCDVSKWSDLANIITQSLKHFGSVPDVYSPVAGVYEPPWSNFWDDTETEQGYYKTIQINVNHPIKFTRLAMKALASENKKGVVCMVASTAGLRANYLSSLYVASKHAVVGMTKSLGQADPEEGVKVVCMCPGMVTSPLWTDRQDDMIKAGRFHERPSMMPIEIAEVMLKMIENKDYSGGTVVLKTKEVEKVVEKGYDQRSEADDPAPRLAPDLSRIRSVLERDRGVPWNPDAAP